MNKIDKNIITGFEKEHIWVNLSKNRTYQFSNDGTGVVLDKNDVSTNIKWELIEKPQSSIIKIGFKGIIYYYIFKEDPIKEEYNVIFKTKDKEEKVKLLMEVVYQKDKTQSKEVPETKQNSQTKYEIKDLDKTDKLFLGFLYSLITLFIIILLKLTEIFSEISILATIFLSLIASTFIIVYLKDPFIHISKKYKKEINDIIFKK